MMRDYVDGIMRELSIAENFADFAALWHHYQGILSSKTEIVRLEI